MRGINNNSKIIVLSTTNPKRGKSKQRFQIYLDHKNITVEEFLKLGGQKIDIHWDIDHGYINLKDGDTTITK